MNFKKGQNIELEITDMAIGGRGIAKIDGLVIFVSGAVQGDRVVARVFKKKKDFAEARTLEIKHESPYRITPPCEYSGYCGGCKWQFIDYKRQLIYKEQFVKDALKHIGQLPDINLHPILPSEKIFGYRNKMEFSCSDRRWLLPEEMGQDIDRSFACGLHVPGTFSKVIDIDACLLQPDIGNNILYDIKKLMKESKKPAYGLKSHEGYWRFCMLRNSHALKKWMVNIVTSHESKELIQSLSEKIVDKYPCIDSLINNITSRKSGVSTGEREIIVHGSPFIQERIGELLFEISANSFFQTNTKQAYNLYKTVEKYALLNGDEFVLDLYSGTGTIPIWLSKKCKRVTGIEIVESAILNAEKNCKINNIFNCNFINGDIRDSLKKIVELPDVLIIDPPRDGMHKDVLKQVLKMDTEKIVYVSCNPATLARDISVLKEKYILKEIQPIDMFPNTFHIEVVARLEKK